MDIQTLLQDEDVRHLSEDLGITDGTPEEQAEVMAQIGENILARVTIEVLKVLPEEAHAEFQKLVGSGNIQALHALVYPYIPNLSLFIKEEARKEIEATKALMQAS